MLKIEYDCCGCGASGNVENTSAMYGQCPKCGRHHGEIEYYCKMTPKEFLDELAKMDETSISKNAYAIQICAEQLSQEL